MTLLLVLLIVASAGAVAFALIRGLHAFASQHPTGLDGDGIPNNLKKQNKMMFARVKWQAITILLIVVLLFVFQAG